MDAQKVQISINLSGIPSSAQQLLQAATYMVAIGLNGKDQITEHALEVPGVFFRNNFNASRPWTVGQSATAWEFWVLRNGFRDVAEAISGALEGAHGILSYWALMRLQAETGSLKGSDWNELVVGRQGRFHRKTLPQRLEFLEKHYGFVFPQEHVERLKSLNAARNCLVHRYGVVTEEDVLPGDDCLTLKWITFVTYVENDGVLTELVPPMTIEGRSSIQVKLVERSKAFGVGEHVSVSAKEFNEICMSFYQFSVTCSQLLRKHGTSMGIVFNGGAP